MLIGNLLPTFRRGLLALSSFYLDYHEEGSSELLQNTGSKLPINRVLKPEDCNLQHNACQQP